MSKHKNDFKPISREERVQITREAIKLAISDFLESRKKEFDQKLLGAIKRLFWWFVGIAILAGFHLMLHGKYQKLADALVGAMSQ